MKPLLLRVLLVLCAWAAWGAEPRPPKPTPKPPSLPGNGQRYLFIVNTSASMGRLEHNGRQALFDMIYTGLDGHMQTGDTYGVWTFNDQVNAGTFPMQVWTTNRLLDLASHATRFVKEQPYSGKKPALDSTVTAAQGVLRLIKDLNIIIICDEKARLHGTPFDELVNGLYEKLAPDLEKTKRPLVTTIVARDGLLANAAVTLAGEPILLPPRPTPEPAVPVATNTVQSAASASPKPGSKSPPLQRDQEDPTESRPPRETHPRTIIISAKQKDPTPKPEIQPEPIPHALPPIMTNAESSPREKPLPPEPPAPSSPNPQASLSPASDTPMQAGPTLTAPPTTSTPPPTDETLQPTLPAVSVLPQSSLGQSSRSPASGSPAGLPRVGSALGQLGSAPRTVAAREVNSPPTAAAETNLLASGLAGLATPPVGSKISPLFWLTAGICCLVLAAVLAGALWKLHRNACQPSVITKSLERTEPR